MSNYFNLFFDKYSDSSIEIMRFVIGSRSKDYYVRKHRRFRYVCQYFLDLLRLIEMFRSRKEIDAVQINPSLIPVPVLRDAAVLVIAKLMRRKGIVFFRGWDWVMAEYLDRHAFLRRLFLFVYSKAECAVVLAEIFKHRLVQWGFPEARVYVSRTMFDGDSVRNPVAAGRGICRFLFLGRISLEKGVFQVLEAASLLRGTGAPFHVTVAGFGGDDEIVRRLKELKEEMDLSDVVEFSGFVKGKSKSLAYERADVFLLPTYHPEGCPNAVLEAMAAGLFVISSDVGALGEIISEGINGSFVRVRDASHLADRMRWATENVDIVRELGQANREYAFRNFEADVIIDQMKTIYREVLRNSRSQENETETVHS